MNSQDVPYTGQSHWVRMARQTVPGRHAVGRQPVERDYGFFGLSIVSCRKAHRGCQSASVAVRVGCVCLPLRDLLRQSRSAWKTPSIWQCSRQAPHSGDVRWHLDHSRNYDVLPIVYRNWLDPPEAVDTREFFLLPLLLPFLLPLLLPFLLPLLLPLFPSPFSLLPLFPSPFSLLPLLLPFLLPLFPSPFSPLFPSLLLSLLSPLFLSPLPSLPFLLIPSLPLSRSVGNLTSQQIPGILYCGNIHCRRSNRSRDYDEKQDVCVEPHHIIEVIRIEIHYNQP